jgi:dipeptidyl aminopeptidase/acylaminoacyl peptidase
LYQPADKHGGESAIVWIHGDIHGATLDLFDAGIQYFVEHGFAVLAPNYRGSVGFEEKLEKARIGMGSAAVQDLPGAVQYLRSQAEIDPARIAAIGFSGGAYLALLTACQNAGIFAVVVDFYGPTDITAFYRDRPETRPLFQAEHGGTPDDKPEAYRSASPIACADQIQAPVLMVHGAADQACPISHSARLAEALKSAKKQYEFITLLGAGHGFFGQDRVRAYDTTMRFISRWLPVRKMDR